LPGEAAASTIEAMVTAPRLRLLACALVAGTGLVLASQAAADGGHDTDVRVKGSCTGSTTSELRVRTQDGRLQIEFRIDTKRRYRAWSLVILRERRIVFRRTVRAGSGGHAVDVRRTIDDWPGTDAIVARASARGGQSCVATVAV
jgi:hypothetical protein